jgi:hypothetical protein
MIADLGDLGIFALGLALGIVTGVIIAAWELRR